jgi:glycosyltransferase involved in cell wall biosynthesis
LKISWLSNAPWCATGYGCQTRIQVPRIVRAGYPAAIIAVYGHEGVPISFQGIPVYGKGFHPWGLDVAAAHSAEFGADIMISLVDAWVIDPQQLGLTRWVPWFPVDHEPIPGPVLRQIRGAFHRLVYSKFAAAEMDRTGIDYDYIPHSIETELYKPTPIKEEQRKYFGLPKDRFIVGMVAANKGVPPRKAFFQHLVAFKALQVQHGDCLMYLHTFDGNPPRPEQADIAGFCEQIGLRIGLDVMFAPQHGLVLGFPDQVMASLYSSFDVLASVSMGEGFGLPILEAQACGTPVIVGDWTSMPELCFSGWKVSKKETEPFYTPLGSFQFLPRAAAIAEAMEAAYQMRGNIQYREEARQGALKYDADKVMDKYWVPVLKKLEAKIQASHPQTESANAFPLQTG